MKLIIIFYEKKAHICLDKTLTRLLENKKNV